MTLVCVGCNRTFTAPSATSKRDGPRKFCSHACYSAHKTRYGRPPMVCSGCGTTFTPRFGVARDIVTGRQSRAYCTPACCRAHFKRARGPDSPGWKGGRRKKNGYICIQLPGSDGSTRYEHRLVAEQMLGRPLEAGEVVHHINGVKTDNRPENLAVMSAREHRLLHARLDADRGHRRRRSPHNPKNAGTL